VKVGPRGKAGPHAAYIARVGRYASRLERSEERLAGAGSGNLPGWAGGNPSVFWQASDAFERANGTAYREMELALPREMDDTEREQLVREFVASELGQRHAYQWAIHVPRASDGLEQPHAHLMFSERQVDGIDRDPDQYFKRYNAKAPERGGARKQFGTATKPLERKAELVALRGRWETTVNLALEEAGLSVRIDMRSLRAQAEDQGLPGELAPVPETRTLPSRWHRGGAREAVQAGREDRSASADVLAERIASVVQVAGLDAAALRAAREAREAWDAVVREGIEAARASAAARHQAEARRETEQREARQREIVQRERQRQAAQRREEARRDRDADAREQLEAAIAEHVERLSEGVMAPEREQVTARLLERFVSDRPELLSGPAGTLAAFVQALEQQAPGWQERERVARLEIAALQERRATHGSWQDAIGLRHEVEADPGVAQARWDEQQARHRELDHRGSRNELEAEAEAWTMQHPVRNFLGMTGPRDALLERAEQAERSRCEAERERVALKQAWQREEARVYGPLHAGNEALGAVLGEINTRHRVLVKRIEQLVPREERMRRTQLDREARRERGREQGRERGGGLEL